MKRSSIIKAAVFGLGIVANLSSYAQVIDPAKDNHVESHVKAFLNVLNSGRENRQANAAERCPGGINRRSILSEG